jgi:predicted nucleic acid-binding protein
LSFLLFPDNQTAAVRVVQGAIDGEFDVVFPAGIAEELRRKVREKPYFRARIAERSLDDLIELMMDVAVDPRESAAWPYQSSDPKDQYLLDAAAGNGVEFLITGDKGLLETTRAPGSALIVTPAQFLALWDLMRSE